MIRKSIKESRDWLDNNQGASINDFYEGTGRAIETLSRIAEPRRTVDEATVWYPKRFGKDCGLGGRYFRRNSLAGV